MQQSCNLKVGHSVYEVFLDKFQEDREKYWKWLIKSLTDENPNVTWCPNALCELSAERTDETRQLPDIRCDCGTVFCFQCSNMAHSPCDCETSKLWI